MKTVILLNCRINFIYINYNHYLSFASVYSNSPQFYISTLALGCPEELPLASIDKIQPVTRDLQYKIEHAVLDLIAKAKDETQELLSSKLDQIKRTVEGSKKLAILLS